MSSNDTHCSLVYNSDNPKMLQDNQIAFNIRQMKKTLNCARHKARKARQVTDSIYSHQVEIYSLMQEISQRQAYLELSHNSARKIQKLFRGYSVRSKYDEEILKIRRKTVSGCLNDLQKTDTNNLTYTGRKPYWAGFILTRFARRLLFLFKIKRLTKVYLHFRMIKEVEGQEYLKKSIQVFYCKNLLAVEKFYKYRKSRLEQTHENLALLTIKIYFDLNIVNFSGFMRRVKKYKRMIKMCKSGSVQSKGEMYSTKDQSTNRSEIFGASSNENLRVEDLGNIMECASLTSTEYVELEKVRREKIQNGMIAYNIQRAKEPIQVLPYLYQKDIVEEHLPPSHYTVLTTCLASRMISTYPRRQSPLNSFRQSPIKTRIELPTLPTLPQTPKKIIFNAENLPNFTRPTQSSLASRSKEENFPETPKNFGSLRENTTLFNQTFSGMQKLMEIKRRSTSSYKKKEFKDGKDCKDGKERLSLPLDWNGKRLSVDARARTTLEHFRK